LVNRLKKHNAGQGSKYVRSRGGGQIIHTESFQTWREALHREMEVKKWPKIKKERLIL
jgi:putative endonuclease